MKISQDSVREFARVLKAQGKLPATIESYSRDAETFIAYLASDANMSPDITPQTLVDFEDYLREIREEKINSIRRSVIGVRQFFRFLDASKRIDATPFDAVPIPERFDDLPDRFPEEDLFDLFTVAETASPPLRARRDLALLALIAYDGLKANEIIELKWSDLLLSEATGSAKIGGTRARGIILSKEATHYLCSYRESYDSQGLPVHSSNAGSHVFVAFKGRDSVKLIPQLSRHGLKFIMYELGAKIGKPHLNTELIRHFAVERLLREGRSAEEIMNHLGLKRLGNIAKHALRQQERSLGLNDLDLIDEHWMDQALRLAEEAGRRGEAPIGAIITKDGKVVATGSNCREIEHRATGHAEVVAIEAANHKLEAWRLSGCTLYVTLEPCLMCAGAIYQSRIDRVVFAAPDPKAGAMGSLYNVHEDHRLNHRLPVKGGVRGEQATTLLREFFKARRKRDTSDLGRDVRVAEGARLEI